MKRPRYDTEGLLEHTWRSFARHGRVAHMGSRLWLLRNALGISAEDAAAMCAIHTNTLRRWEAMHNSPDADSIRVMRDVLYPDINLHWLITGEGPPIFKNPKITSVGDVIKALESA